MADKYNIPNIYVDLIRKIKQIEGVDIEYIDKLVELLYQDINRVDNAVGSILDLIPDDASTTNQLATDSDIPIMPTVPPADYQAEMSLYVQGWTQSGDDYINEKVLPDNVDIDYIPTIALYEHGNVSPEMWNTPDYNKIYWVKTFNDNGVKKARFYSHTIPDGQITIVFNSKLLA